MKYTDRDGREWLAREIVGYSEHSPLREFPQVMRSAVVFESDWERRLADDAPLDWRARAGALDELFARARLLTERESRRDA